MKKLLAIILAMVFVFALTACGEGETKGDDSSTPEISSETTTSAEEATSSNEDISSTVSTSVENSSKGNVVSPSSSKPNSSKPSSSKPTVSKKPAAPTTLNPKTNLKIGKYEAKYVDGNTYVVCILEYGKNFGDDTLLLNKCIYYNKQGANDRLGSMGMTFDEADYNKITVGGVDYFDLEELSWSILPVAIELTDTLVKVSEDYSTWTNFTLLTNNSLKQENAPNNYYAKAGAIFTYKG